MRKPTPKQSVKPTRVVILLDRTGSMDSVKKETITGFNSYLDTLGDAKNTTVTAVQFDSQSIDNICEAVSVKNAPRLNGDTYQPRAMTPLYDAIGRTITKTKESCDGEKVLFVILTDGQENASVEWNEIRVKSLMRDRENMDKWTFAYIGIGPDGWASMRNLSAQLQSSSNVLMSSHTGEGVKKAYARAGGQSVAYTCSIGSDNAVLTNFWGQKDEDASS